MHATRGNRVSVICSPNNLALLEYVSAHMRVCVRACVCVRVCVHGYNVANTLHVPSAVASEGQYEYHLLPRMAP